MSIQDKAPRSQVKTNWPQGRLELSALRALAGHPFELDATRLDRWAEKAETIEDRSKRTRLHQLDEEADALAKQQDALTAKDEARRLRSAASKAKATRKDNGSG